MILADKILKVQEDILVIEVVGIYLMVDNLNSMMTVLNKKILINKNFFEINIYISIICLPLVDIEKKLVTVYV